MTEPVDTVKLRQAAETAARAHNVPDYIFEIMHAAADELDELRKEADQMNVACVAHAKESAELRRVVAGEQARADSLARRIIDTEQAAHAETNRELEEMRERLESAEEVCRKVLATDLGVCCSYVSAEAHFARFGGGNG